MSGAGERVLARRRSGVLLPAASLRLDHRGALGDPALRFIDWLADAGFSVWQLLPLVPTDENGSPYWARSDRAGSSELADATAPDPGTEDDLAAFRAASSAWLDDYTLFEALSAEQGGAPWWQWPGPLKRRHPVALAAARQRLAPRLTQLARAQWRFDEQWRALRRHAQARGVKIFGDLPIYVAPDSVATWASPRSFQLDDEGNAVAVSGVPPDYFAEDGQLWGNPLYDWEAQRRDGFRFWMQRLALQSDRFDLLRIDHFRALDAYWSVPFGAASARVGEWRPAPGGEMLERARQLLPQLELVAEDLGVITPAVNALRQRFGLPGMRVLQFGFDGDPANLHLPHAHSADCVVYTGTHDNDTTAGWYASLDARARDHVRRYLARPDHEVLDAMLRAALGSVGVMAVLPMQDILQLGSEARLNRPGTTTGNWAWRLPGHSLTADLAARYRDLNQLYDRS
ncbi:MAG TPA: 4-alpha-glucanotransferase [Steroidobacteraceae bacterium]|nr:4-alpha-glucanotransferase [Steroidobacteraceae bacterium]